MTGNQVRLLNFAEPPPAVVTLLPRNIETMDPQERMDLRKEIRELFEHLWQILRDRVSFFAADSKK